MKKIVIVFGTTGGNTEMAAEAVAEILGKKHKVDVRRAELNNAKDLLKYDVCILASPTYGHGLLEAHMAKFVKGMKEIDLKGKPCAVIGLGDPKYEQQYHIESAPILEKKLTDIGGKLLLPALRISMTPIMHLKGFIPHWTKQLMQVLSHKS